MWKNCIIYRGWSDLQVRARHTSYINGKRKKPHTHIHMSLLSSLVPAWQIRCSDSETLKTKRDLSMTSRDTNCVARFQCRETHRPALTHSQTKTDCVWWHKSGLNSVFATRAEHWGGEREMYRECWKLTQYIRKPRGAALIFSFAESCDVPRSCMCELRWLLHTIAPQHNFISQTK